MTYDLFARHQAEWEEKGLDVEAKTAFTKKRKKKIKPAYYHLMRVD